ncbi:hypothetical protein NVU42_004484, partial [Salmonella enterica]|nr:hypothetical protein [Salmonella enterica]
MNHVSHISHRLIQYIRHPIHPEHRNTADSDVRFSPVTQQGNIAVNARVLFDAGHREDIIYSNMNVPERQSPGISFMLNHKFERVCVPEHNKIENESIIRLCKEGEKIYGDIMKGRQIASTKDNVIKIMWYLQARASGKINLSVGLKYEGPQIFKMGAFSVEDREYRLEDFFNKVGSYSRKSSHLREYQKAGAEYQPRGLDILSKDGYLPHNRKTILFERMPQKSNAIPTGIPGKNMLFIKMEEHGCFRKRDKIAHLGNYIPTLLEQRFGVVKTDSGVDNRERIPPDLKKQYSDILSRYEQIKGQKSVLSDATSMTGGVKTMIDNLYRMQNYISGKISASESSEKITGFFMELKNMSDQLKLRDH